MKHRQTQKIWDANQVVTEMWGITAITIHRLRLQCGLPGIPENEQIVAHLFWREMSKLFLAENGVPLHGYPDDFDGLVKFCEKFENVEKPLGLIFWYQETQLDDPTESYIEKREHMTAEEKEKLKTEIWALDRAFPEIFVANYKDDPHWAGCPYHEALSKYMPDATKEAATDDVHAIEARAAVIEKD